LASPKASGARNYRRRSARNERRRARGERRRRRRARGEQNRLHNINTPPTYLLFHFLLL
jgi:hypothetical protein